MTTQFVEVAADLKRRKLAILTETWPSRSSTPSEQLREAETRLESYRVSTITLPTENVPVAAGLQSTQPTVLTNYFNQKIQVEELKRDRTALQGVVARIGTPGFSMDAFQTIPAVRNAPDLNRALEELSSADAELRALKFRYTDEHKPVRDLQDRINTLRTQTIPALANGLVPADADAGAGARWADRDAVAGPAADPDPDHQRAAADPRPAGGRHALHHALDPLRGGQARAGQRHSRT